MRHVFLTIFCFFAVPVHAQGTRAEGHLILEANSKQTETSGATNLVYRFPETRVEGESIARVIVYNPTESPLTSLVGTILNAHFRFLGNAYPGEGGTCGKTLAARSTCVVTMRFAPQSLGAKRGLVRLNYWEEGQPRTSYRQLVGESSSVDPN